MKDLLRATVSRGRPVADIEQGATSSIACILANLSMELDRSLHWDAASGRVIGDDEANTRLQRPYRQPWAHPAGAWRIPHPEQALSSEKSFPFPRCFLEDRAHFLR